MNNDTYKINKDSCSKWELTVPELLILLLIKTDVNIKETVENMLKKQMLVRDENNELLITERWNNAADSAILDADDAIPDDVEIEQLVIELMNCFPTGKKSGTNIYWKNNRKDNILRLKKFYKKYGNTYTTDDILKATQRYVESFNGKWDYMRVLKYFIWKDTKKEGEDGKLYIEETSDLATYIENLNQTDVEWRSELR